MDKNSSSQKEYNMFPVEEGLYFSDLSIDNLTDFLNTINQVHEGHSSNIAIFGIFLTICAFLINVMIVVAALSSNELRGKPHLQCIANLCVANISSCVFINPLAIYSELGDSWSLSNTLCRVWIMVDLYIPFVCMLVLLVATLDPFIVIYCPAAYIKTNSCFRPISHILLPWTVSFVILFPILITGTLPTQEIPGYCILVFDSTSSIITPVLSYFIPAVSVIIIMITTLMGNFRDNEFIQGINTRSVNSRSFERGTSNNANESDGEHVSLIILYITNCIFIVIWFPHQFVSLLLSFCHSCFPPYDVIIGFTWLGASSSLIVPLVWLFDRNMRTRLGCLIKCFLSKNKTEEDEEGTEVQLMDL